MSGGSTVVVVVVGTKGSEDELRRNWIECFSLTIDDGEALEDSFSGFAGTLQAVIVCCLSLLFDANTHSFQNKLHWSAAALCSFCGWMNSLVFLGGPELTY